MAVSHNNQNNDQVVSSGVSFDGMLAVTTNAGDGPLVAGDTFQLFNSGIHDDSGFDATNLPALSPGLGWTNTLGVDERVCGGRQLQLHEHDWSGRIVLLPAGLAVMRG